MKHRIFTLLLALMILLCALPVSAEETTAPTEAERAPGYCGDAIQWRYESGVLTLTGTGRMDDCFEGAPWAEYKNEIHTVILSGSITYVGAYAFTNCDTLQTVDFGSALQEVGQRAFYSCDGLTSVTLPQTFICFGPESFMGCRNLKAFHCNGVCPHFRLNCLRDTYGIIYYPASRPWPLDVIIELEAAFHGRIEFLASDGTDPYEPVTPTIRPDDPTEPPAPPVKPPTEPPVVPSTEPPASKPADVPTETTSAATSAPTEAATVPAEAPTAPTEQTSAPTETATAPHTTAPAETESAATRQPSEPEPPVSDAGKTTWVPWYFLSIYMIAGAGLALLIPVRLLNAARRKRRKKKPKKKR